MEEDLRLNLAIIKNQICQIENEGERPPVLDDSQFCCRQTTDHREISGAVSLQITSN